MARVPAAWTRRAVLAAVLAGAAVIPGYAAGSAAGPCTGPHCGPAGKVLWTRLLPGSWTASDTSGTVLASGQAYAAAGGRVAVIGSGLTVTAFGLRTGRPLWTTVLARLPPGATIESVRAWPGVVTAGVAVPPARRGRPLRREVVLRASTGAPVRDYPAAAYGGAVDATAATTVIVGRTSVTSYDNKTGRPRWRRRTGRVPQAWRADGSDLYVTIAAGGYLGTAPVTGLRQISLRTGAQRVIRPHGRAFAGALSGAFDGVVLFSGARGVTAYSGATGQRLWARAGAVPDSVDEVQSRLYLTKGSTLIGVNPETGARNRRRVAPGSAGLYGVRDGVALGLDQGSAGDAWGYDVARKRVVWTTPQLPWPHYFVDLSSIGGSADAAGNTVLITSCARLGGTRTAAAAPATSAVPSASVSVPGSASTSASASTTSQPAVQAGQICQRPELVAIQR